MADEVVKDSGKADKKNKKERKEKKKLVQGSEDRVQENHLDGRKTLGKQRSL